MKRYPSGSESRHGGRRRSGSWVGSPAHRKQASDAISNWNAHQKACAKRCGAIRRFEGVPCRRYAMENGRCYYHGGATPKGADWHKPKWPKKTSPRFEEKLQAKLKKRDRDYLERKRQLAEMSAEARAAHERRRADNRPGTPDQRAARRAERSQAVDAKRTFNSAKQPVRTPEVEALDAQIQALKARRAELADLVSPQRPYNEGVFG